MTITIGRQAVDLLSQASVKTLVDAVAAILLIVLLVEGELIRAAAQHWRHQSQAFGAVAVPLLITFAVAMGARLAAFL